MATPNNDGSFQAPTISKSDLLNAAQAYQGQVNNFFSSNGFIFNPLTRSFERNPSYLDPLQQQQLSNQTPAGASTISAAQEGARIGAQVALHNTQQLTPQEQQQYGVGAGSTYGDVNGQTPYTNEQVGAAPAYKSAKSIISDINNNYITPNKLPTGEVSGQVSFLSDKHPFFNFLKTAGMTDLDSKLNNLQQTVQDVLGITKTNSSQSAEITGMIPTMADSPDQFKAKMSNLTTTLDNIMMRQQPSSSNTQQDSTQIKTHTTKPPLSSFVH